MTPTVAGGHGGAGSDTSADEDWPRLNGRDGKHQKRSVDAFEDSGDAGTGPRGVAAEEND